MNIFISTPIRTSRWILVAMLIGVLATAPGASADDLTPEIPDADAMVDSSAPNQVLEIPQQCDKDSVAVLCDSGVSTADVSVPGDSGSANTPAQAEANPAGSSTSDLASNPNLGSANDYANQSADAEAASASTMYVPAPVFFFPAYPRLSPGPVIVSSRPMGPGFYQPGTRGPGFYQSPVPGPGFGMRPLGGIGNFGGGHFGRR